MPGVFQVVGAVYELSTVVTDIVLNREYIERKWTEEYALSIAFLVFNGLVMAVVGLQLEAKRPQHRRYVRWGALNKAIAALLGLLQLRVLAESFYSYSASRQAEKEAKLNHSSHQPISTAQNQPPIQPQETSAQRAVRLEHGLVFVAFVQAMVRDVPVFIIQANATIHYRKWELLDLWAVVSTGVTLVKAVSSYVNSEKTNSHTKKKQTSSTTLAYSATLFLLGQFVFRLGAVLLVATTKGLAIVVYAGTLTLMAILLTVTLRLATPAQATAAQVGSAVLFFPLFSVFTLDAAHAGPLTGDVRQALYSRKLLLLNAWRVVENAVGVVLAVTLPRYTNFGRSSDSEIALIGLACGAFYLLSLLVFVCAARAAPKATESELIEGEDTTLYLQNHNAPHGGLR